MHKPEYYISLFLGLYFSFNLTTSGQEISSPDQPFYLKGHIKNYKGQFVRLIFTHEDRSRTEDTVYLDNGRFYFKRKIPETTRVILSADKPSQFSIRLFIEPNSEMDIVLESFESGQFSVTGSETQAEAERYAIKTKDLKDLDQLLGYAINYAIKNPHSFFAITKLDDMSSELSPELKDSLYQNLTPEIKRSLPGRSFLQKLEKEKEVAVGKVAKNFKSLDLAGDSLSLYNYDNYVLLDFWASWCIPCREYHPKLIEIHNAFNKRGLDIIGIASDDNHKDKWRRAVEEDRIGLWKHVLIGKNTNMDISNLYDIHLFPTKILINPDGIIIGRYVGSKDHERFYQDLEEIFGSAYK